MMFRYLVKWSANHLVELELPSVRKWLQRIRMCGRVREPVRQKWGDQVITFVLFHLELAWFDPHSHDWRSPQDPVKVHLLTTVIRSEYISQIFDISRWKPRLTLVYLDSTSIFCFMLRFCAISHKISHIVFEFISISLILLVNRSSNADQWPGSSSTISGIWQIIDFRISQQAIFWELLLFSVQNKTFFDLLRTAVGARVTRALEIGNDSRFISCR